MRHVHLEDISALGKLVKHVAKVWSRQRLGLGFWLLRGGGVYREGVDRGQAKSQSREWSHSFGFLWVIKEQHAGAYQRTGNVALRQRPLRVDHPSGLLVLPQLPKGFYPRMTGSDLVRQA